MIATLIPDFRLQDMEVERIEQLARQTAEALDRASVPYAVVGGNAVAAWVRTAQGAVRATKDVDILLRRSDLPAASAALAKVGLDERDVHGVTMFLTRQNPNPKTGVHVVFAGERVRASSAYPAPDVSASVLAPSGIRVLDLPALLLMKLEANRRIDQVHVEDMLAAGLIDDTLVAKLPPDLQARLREIDQTRQPPH